MCPVCGNKTRLKIREDTELKKFPLYCPKCRQENLIEIKQFKVTVITEPDAKTQSRYVWILLISLRCFLLR
ncbi:cysteine-rich KTR domain-containing protein [Enterococcus faecalis]|nr:cysteine-rich KTR domain-containing protein [Enterococcus faecalis]HDY5938982.1 cysteine-rich KTR domain-containing protein [Staphylococcus aureus]HEN2964874.1 cysteine-rich KTR domain-containing protein [Streptococcus agalactiae]EHK9418170.1 cysteine-rich KTR domain-containing protein [Enterococcus faecalis]EHR4739289.1 cysteine-rich KTR domain-containing protein [Enterococcus faecalis]